MTTYSLRKKSPVHRLATVWAIVCMIAPVLGYGQGRTRYEDFDTSLKTSQSVGALGSRLFGDETDPYTGSTNFWVTDVSLPGNSALSVALVRRFKGIDDGVGEYMKWSNFEAPYLAGIFPDGSASRDLNGWNSWVRGSYEKRCQNVTPPPEVKQSDGKEDTFMADEYFHGIRLNLPGGETQLMLSAFSDAPKPGDGQTYRWATNGDWRFSCLAQLKNAYAGDGFLGRDPAGNKYYFDWMVAGADAGQIRKRAFNGGDTGLSRREYRLYATRIEDRFGNWVDYGYQGKNLSSIVASDGRSLALTYDASAARLVSVTDGRRTWSYEYPTNGVKLIYPDGSVWSSSLAGQISRVGMNGCQGTGPVVRFTGAATLTLQHPSGAVGQFSFANLRRGVSYVKWWPLPGSVWCDQEPKVFDGIALQQKTIHGPGVAAMNWTFAYGPANACYTGAGQSDDCTAASPVTRTVDVNGPAGTFVRYVYGNKAYETDGMLLRTEWGGNGMVLKTVNQAWQVFDGVGLPLNGAGNHYWEQRRRRLKNAETVQDGAHFHSDVNGFDSFLRPTSVSSWSSLGYARTDVTTYYDNAARWVLGQTASETNQETGAVASNVEFDAASAMPVAIYEFGKLQQTLTYHPDGNVATIADGRGLVVSLSNWKRGVPQLVRYHDGTQKVSVVDDNGWIASATDENSITTSYEYDPMGRMARIVYPTGDDTLWNDTRLRFEQVGSDESGVPAGHWRQTVTTGNRKSTVLFDALLRPVVEREEDVADPRSSARWIMKCYDHEGRKTFESYPRNPVVDGSRFNCSGVDR
ncbi:RHS repeat protein [Lysobacter enzymogenes]|uniref:RHS repeat protein n=1 Tax=Lysobacter enzymogenes TaxID=69 RepID=UPI001A979023|nr:RHS repeat domain-containing protein [Lysobacter enzymogenes]QQP98574.1 RHS repeat protein [Lysobacter enzymogenes]